MDLLPVRRQQAVDPSTLPNPPGVPYDLFIGFLWAGFAVATIFIAGRLYARLCSKSSRRIYLDDAFIFFAYILLLTTAGLWEWGAKDMYYIMNVSAGVEQMGLDFKQHLHRFLIVSFMAEIFFYTILIMFKLSLLFFFKRLSSSADKFNYFWWPTLVFTLCTYFVGIGMVDYRCYFGSFEVVAGKCGTPSGSEFTNTSLLVNCVLDVVSDFLIMVIPIILLWNIQVRWGKKLALFGLFSLSIITIAVAIARTADVEATRNVNGVLDSSYLWFWTSLQSFLCIVVACSSAFRQLFVASTKSSSKPTWTATDSFYDRMISSFQSKNKKSKDSNIYDIPDVNQVGEPFDYMTMRKESEASSQQSSQSSEILPNPSTPVAAGYQAPSQDYTYASQITKKTEYSVTRGSS